MDSITTPVTVVSAEIDVVNDTSRHAMAVARLPIAKHFVIRGARHRMWRESDEYRDALLGIVDSVLLNAAARRLA